VPALELPPALEPAAPIPEPASPTPEPASPVLEPASPAFPLEVPAPELDAPACDALAPALDTPAAPASSEGAVEPELLLHPCISKSPAIASELVLRPRTHFVLIFMMSSHLQVKECDATQNVSLASAIF
jgi:hypothetical protein